MPKKTDAEQVEPNELVDGTAEASEEHDVEVAPAEDTVEEPAPPKPGDADYDWTPHYPDGVKLYRHVYPDGQVVALRRFLDITSKQWLMNLGEYATDFAVESSAVSRAGCPEAIAIIRSRPAPVDGPDDFQDLWNAWTSWTGDDEDTEEPAKPGE
ncbi:putative tail assembly protein [Tsukamurella phage TPA4]|uniref:tail assembly protein n=1 Tax=Tsukamurella phage TPA4 TaxID=1647476 RepID=UPI0007B61A5B|nr:tail assembly protein [Tsukamurella phage TPA4]AKJ72180.1 putative tail assembly protein [Tsukamurella phage TPA4]